VKNPEQYIRDLTASLISKHDEIMAVFNDEMGIKSVLTQEFYDEGQHVKKNYAFFGSGCGISWVVFDKRSTAAKDLFDRALMGKAIAAYKQYFISQVPKPTYDYFKSVGFSVEATLGQNMVLNGHILNLVVDYAKEFYGVKNCYVKTVID
jgi:hypothetical protein